MQDDANNFREIRSESLDPSMDIAILIREMATNASNTIRITNRQQAGIWCVQACCQTRLIPGC